MRSLFSCLAVVLVACSSAPVEQGATSAELVTCAESRWLGEIDDDGESLRVISCIGDECSDEFAVNVIIGSSCVVVTDQGEGTLSGATPSPDADGQGTADLSAHAQSSAGKAEFIACAIREPGVDGGGGGSPVQLEVRVVMGDNNAWAVGETASLQVRDENDAVVVDEEFGIGPVDSLGKCTGFNEEF